MKRNNGSALIAALLVVALAVAALLLVQVSHQASIQRTQKMLNYLKAYTFAQGMESWAVGRLKTLRGLNELDQAKQPWPIRVDERLDDGNLISGELMDAQALWNVNTLQSDQDKVKLRRLIKASRLPNEASISEQIYTLVQFHRSLNSTAPITLINELNVTNIPHLSPLLANMIALPDSNTRINLNTASAPVILSLSKDLNESQVTRFVQMRDKNNLYQYVILAAQALSPDNYKSFIDNVSVDSKYFLLHTHVQRDEIQFDMLSLFYTNNTEGAKSIDLLWHGFI